MGLGLYVRLLILKYTLHTGCGSLKPSKLSRDFGWLGHVLGHFDPPTIYQCSFTAVIHIFFLFTFDINLPSFAPSYPLMEIDSQGEAPLKDRLGPSCRPPPNWWPCSPCRGPAALIRRVCLCTAWVTLTTWLPRKKRELFLWSACPFASSSKLPIYIYLHVRRNLLIYLPAAEGCKNDWSGRSA